MLKVFVLSCSYSLSSLLIVVSNKCRNGSIKFRKFMQRIVLYYSLCYFIHIFVFNSHQAAFWLMKLAFLVLLKTYCVIYINFSKVVLPQKTSRLNHHNSYSVGFDPSTHILFSLFFLSYTYSTHSLTE